MEDTLIRPPTDCVFWTGYIHRTGYGHQRDGDRIRQAHVVAWESVHGPVPEGMVLDHTCHDPETCIGGWSCIHRRCVNVEHLEPVTQSENQRRGKNGGRGHLCRNGLHVKTGEGDCIECTRERRRRWKKKMRAAGQRHISG